jgi:hypothetical protein
MSNRSATLFGIASFFFLLCPCPAALAQLFTPEQMLSQVHAYEGDHRPATQIATVFRAPPERTGLLASICNVDGGKRLWAWSTPCPLVVYLLPGTHQLTIRYSTVRAGASPTIPIRVEAGKTYMVVGTVSGERNAFGVMMSRVATSISTMPEGFALTYKDIYPTYYAKGDKPNSRVNPEDAR